MKKILILALFICLGSHIFAQELSLGFQYGTARVFDEGQTVRRITEPGLLLTFRLLPESVGFFGRIGLLFPSRVSEGPLTLSYDQYNYIVFLNAALGASFKVPMNDQFMFIIDAGMSINNLFYGGSFRDTIDASWSIFVQQLGTTISGGHTFNNIKMSHRYNDYAFGILANVAARYNFNRNFYMELGLAASFDFLRYRSYKFTAEFEKDADKYAAASTFPADKLEGLTGTGSSAKADRLVLESSGYFNVFKQFTFIPSLSVGYSF